MKNKIKELMVITTNSKTLEEFKENFKKGYLELLDFDEINRLNKEENRLYNSIDKVINGKKFEKDKEKVVFALRDLLEALNELEKNAMKPLVKLENTGNKELEDKRVSLINELERINLLTKELTKPILISEGKNKIYIEKYPHTPKYNIQTKSNTKYW